MTLDVAFARTGTGTSVRLAWVDGWNGRAVRWSGDRSGNDAFREEGENARNAVGATDPANATRALAGLAEAPRTGIEGR